MQTWLLSVSSGLILVTTRQGQSGHYYNKYTQAVQTCQETFNFKTALCQFWKVYIKLQAVALFDTRCFANIEMLNIMVYPWLRGGFFSQILHVRINTSLSFVNFQHGVRPWWESLYNEDKWNLEFIFQLHCVLARFVSHLHLGSEFTSWSHFTNNNFPWIMLWFGQSFFTFIVYICLPFSRVQFTGALRMTWHAKNLSDLIIKSTLIQSGTTLIWCFGHRQCHTDLYLQ